MELWEDKRGENPPPAIFPREIIPQKNFPLLYNPLIPGSQGSSKREGRGKHASRAVGSAQRFTGFDCRMLDSSVASSMRDPKGCNRRISQLLQLMGDRQAYICVVSRELLEQISSAHASLNVGFDRRETDSQIASLLFEEIKTIGTKGLPMHDLKEIGSRMDAMEIGYNSLHCEVGPFMQVSFLAKLSTNMRI